MSASKGGKQAARRVFCRSPMKTPGGDARTAARVRARRRRTVQTLVGTKTEVRVALHAARQAGGSSGGRRCACSSHETNQVVARPQRGDGGGIARAVPAPSRQTHGGWQHTTGR